MSAAKQKGTRAETAVVDYLRAHHFRHVERRALNGAKDRGDIAGIPGVVLEVKNHASLDLAGWVRELEQEMSNDGALFGAVIHKRRGKTDPGEWYATMPVKTLVAILTALA